VFNSCVALAFSLDNVLRLIVTHFRSLDNFKYVLG
jgi:hypothetical protein